MEWAIDQNQSFKIYLFVIELHLALDDGRLKLKSQMESSQMSRRQRGLAISAEEEEKW